jgi:hypothetical protein
MSTLTELEDFFYTKDQTFSRDELNSLIAGVSGGDLGPATIATVPAAAASGQSYSFTDPGTYLFKDASNTAITVPAPPTGKAIINGRFYYNGAYYKAVYSLITIPAAQNKIQPWTASAYNALDQVNYNGLDYFANAGTVAGDVPGVSTKWTLRLNYALPTDIYTSLPVSNTVSATDAGNGVGTALAAINDVPISETGILQTIAGNFTGAGICNFVIVTNKTLIGGVSYAFTTKPGFSVNIPAAGLQTIDVSAQGIQLTKGDYIGVQNSSTSQPKYGADTNKGYGWYRRDEALAGTQTYGYVANAGYAFSITIKAFTFRKVSDSYSSTQADALLSAKAAYPDVFTDWPSNTIGSNTTSNAAVMLVNDVPSAYTGVISKMVIKSVDAGVATFQVLERLTRTNNNQTAGGKDTFNVISNFNVTLSAGTNNYTLATPVTIKKGQYVAWASNTGAPRASFSGVGVGNLGWWQGGVGPQTGSALLTYQPAQVGFSYTVKGNNFALAADISTPTVAVTRITATRNANDFNSIRDIIKNISDAGPYNQYEIFVPNGMWFEFDLQGKAYVTVIGESRDGAILYCDSTQTAAKYVVPADYSYPAEVGKQINAVADIYLHVVFGKNNQSYKNITLWQTRGKYAVHLDNNGYTTADFYNCRIKENQCADPVGIGTWGGQAITFNKCIFEREFADVTIRAGIFCHNSTGQTKGASVKVIDGLFLKCSYLLIDELGSNQVDTFDLINCQTNAMGEVQWMVDYNSSTKNTFWINPATGNAEPDPKAVPYCWNLNCSGTKVDLVTIRDSSAFNAGYNTGQSRPLALDRMVTDYYGYCVLIVSNPVLKGDILCLSASTSNENTIPQAQKFFSFTANGPLLGVALQDNTGVTGELIKYAPIGKYAETFVNGAIGAGTAAKKLDWDPANFYLVSSPTIDSRQAVGLAYRTKAAGYSTVIAKLL